MSGTLAIGAAPPPQQPPATPVSPALVSSAAPTGTQAWGVTHFDSRCVLLRHFGHAPNEVLLGIEPLVASNARARIVVVTDIARIEESDGPAQVAFDDDARGRTSFIAYGISQPPGRVVIVENVAVERTRAAHRVQLHADGVTLRLSLAGMAAEWPALERCVAVRRAELHIEAALLDPATAADPIGDPAAWFGSNDFPADAARNGASGMIEVVWRVEVDGRVTDCRSISTLGPQTYEHATCQALQQRGRFHPAQDAAGRPVVSYRSQRVTWRWPHA